MSSDEHYWQDPGTVIGGAITVYAMTNMDGFVIILTYFARPDFKQIEVIMGFIFGFITLVLISAIGCGLGAALPSGYVELIGLIPFAIGVWKLHDGIRYEWECCRRAPIEDAAATAEENEDQRRPYADNDVEANNVSSNVDSTASSSSSSSSSSGSDIISDSKEAASNPMIAHSASSIPAAQSAPADDHHHKSSSSSNERPDADTVIDVGERMKDDIADSDGDSLLRPSPPQQHWSLADYLPSRETRSAIMDPTRWHAYFNCPSRELLMSPRQWLSACNCPSTDLIMTPSRWMTECWCPNRNVLELMLITISNGGDNVSLYLPILAIAPSASVLLILFVWAIMVSIWLFTARMLVSHPKVSAVLQKYSTYILPFLFIAIGLYIFSKSIFVTKVILHE